MIVGDDIIIEIDGNRVINGDYFMSYLEEHTLPNQNINIKVIRNNQEIDLSVKLESRPTIV